MNPRQRTPLLRPFAIALALAIAPSARAQTPAAPPSSDPGATPRSALSRYLDLCRDGRYEDATRFLELPPALEQRGPDLARRLKSVLDQDVWFDVNLVCDSPTGNTADGLPANLEELAGIPGARGVAEPVRMVRLATGRGHL